MARELAGLSGTELGRGLGGSKSSEDATRQSVSDWEAERHYPNVKQLYLLCEKLGISADYLVNGKGPMNMMTGDVAALLEAFERYDPKGREVLVRIAINGAPAKVVQFSGEFSSGGGHGRSQEM